MFKVKITKQGIETHGARFPTQEGADAWIASNVANNSWGLPERWLTQVEADLAGVVISNQESRVRGQDDMGQDILEYKIPAEYTVEISDATAEYQAELDEQESREAIDLGVTIIAKVRTINKSKLRSGAWDAAKLQQLLVNQDLSNLERLCWNGTLSTAKALIQSLDNTFYSSQEKQEIIALIDAHLTKWS
jgi:hypothetical protein